jgi:molecular chaperone HscB
MFDLCKNHFELFGLPVDFVVDQQALKRHYRDLQRVVHPDRFAAASAHERRLSLQRATLVNEAFEILSDPLKRADYLLSLLGVEAPNNSATLADAEFLMQQLELREMLAQIKHQADPLASLEALLRRVHQLSTTLLAKMAILFEEATPKALQEVQKSVAELRFLNKLNSEAEALEAELEGPA